MNTKKELCRNFQRGSCRYGAHCRYLHTTPQQQPKSNPFGFGSQSNTQLPNAGQQQSPNPFGFGVSTQNKPFGNTWVRPQTPATNTSQKGNAQGQTGSHEPDKCTDPETCKSQIVEDFKNELPLWRLSCYGHCKYLPCDIAGDISYEELRAAAYDEARRGVPLQAIIERERNTYNAKSMEYDNLSRSPYVIRSSNAPQTNPFSAVKTTTSPFGTQSNSPPAFSSFSQLGSSVRPPAATTPNSIFGQPNLPQFNSQGLGGFGTNFGNSGLFGSQQQTQPSPSSSGLFGSQQPTQSPATAPGLFGSQLQTQPPPATSPGLFGSQMPAQPFGSTQGPNSFNFQNVGVGNTVSSPSVPPQFPSSTSNNLVVSDQLQQTSTLEDKQEDYPDSIWLEKQWKRGEIPITPPPHKFWT